MRLSEIGALLGAEMLGKDVLVTDVAPAHSAGPNQLTLCNDRRRFDALRNTQAAGVLLPNRLRSRASELPCSVLLVKDVRLALAIVLAKFHPPQTPDPYVAQDAFIDDQARVHPSAVIMGQAQIMAQAQIGQRSLIEAGAYIGPGAVVGNDCRISQRAVILGCCKLGNRVRIGPATVLGSDGFGYVPTKDGLQPMPQIGSVVIEDDVDLGANCTVDRGTLGPTIIGQGTKIDNLVQIAHNVVIGKNVCIAAQTGISGSVTIADGVMMGGQVGVGDGLTIGKGAQIGGKSGVVSNVPEGARVAGYPAIDLESWLNHAAAMRKTGLQHNDSNSD